MKPMNAFGCVFAAEDDDGRLGAESVRRCFAAVEWYLREETLGYRPVILLAAGITGKKQELPHAALMRAELLRHPAINPENVVIVCDKAANSAEEIAAFEAYLAKHDDWRNYLTAVSSWYHLYRIQYIWLKKYGRTVRFVNATADPDDMKRARLEPLKMVLAMVDPPSVVHRTLGAVMRFLKLI